MKSNNLTSFSNDYYFKKSNNLILTKFKLHLNKIFFISNETSINLINYNSNVYITLTSELKNIMFLHAMVIFCLVTLFQLSNIRRIFVSYNVLLCSKFYIRS